MPSSPFTLDHAPKVGSPERLADDLLVVTADNPSPMTFTGTRTFVLGTDAVALIDPGPDIGSHAAAILEAIGGRPLEAIFVTHAHFDHSASARRWAEQTGAKLYGCSRQLAAQSETKLELGDLAGGEGIDRRFAADIELEDETVIEGHSWRLEAVHTPGHLSDHMCFSDGRRLYTGDHVMGWASSMISPPEGNLTAFMSSLEKLLTRVEQAYYPGHGPVVQDGHTVVRYLLEHRRGRESEILKALSGTERTIAELTAEIYNNVDKRLHAAAARNVTAHLIDLYHRDLVDCGDVFSANAAFACREKGTSTR